VAFPEGFEPVSGISLRRFGARTGEMIGIWHWHTEPLLVGGMLFVLWLYWILVAPLRAWVAPGEPFPRREFGCFTGGLLMFYVAVGSPIDAMGENFLFSAHMVQHNIIMYLATPLFIWGTPAWLIEGTIGRARAAAALMRFWVHPLTAGFAFTFVFCGWHFPVLYEAALHDKAIHAIEHLTMFFVSLLMFWPLLSRSGQFPPMSWGMRILYMFVLMVAQIPLFAILTFSPEVLYPTYELAPRIFPIEPDEDQVLGGLIMKVANMLVSLAVMGYAFVRWNRERE